MSEPNVTQLRHTFSYVCAVTVKVRARASVLWDLLSDAEQFPRWNSTVKQVEGHIRDGERLRLHVPGTDRVFTPRVGVVKQDECMTWTGGAAPLFKGVRTFVLKPGTDGTTDFTMQERFSGLMLPLVRRSLPDFGPVFATFALDLKREAERAA